jgi:molecular chaperone GrpE
MEAEKQTEAQNSRQGEEPAGEPEQGRGEPEAASRPEEDLAYQKLAAEKRELYDRLLRKQAEFDNFRKRMQKEKEEFLQHANADLIRSLLPVLDAFDRALKQRDPTVPGEFYDGMELIYRQLQETLARAGLSSVETEGHVFDPAVHEAVETVTASRYRDREVVEEVQRGYKLKHRLLRPAVVKVAMQPQKGNTGGPPGSSAGPE